MNIFFRNFFLKLLSFISSVILVLIFSVVLKTNFPFIIDKYKKELVFKKNIEIAIFGDSEIHGALDSNIIQKALKKQTNNLAIGGQTIFMNILKIRDILKFNPNALIIIDYGSNDVSYRGDMIRDEGDLFEEIGYKFAISNNFQFMNIDELFFFIKNFPLVTIQSIMKGVFSYNHILHTGIDLNLKSNISEQIINIDDLISKKDSIFNSKHIINENFPFLKLKSLFKNHPSSNFILVNPPEFQLNKKVYKDDSLKWQKNVNEFKKFKNVKIFNFKDFKMNLEDFEDFSHLTKKGMQKFSLELTKNLNLN